ncbi:UrcA family protein [Novosphingobium sp. Leaf2]|uniref:UrcA family protein n=1 Tax=Novosphingobium sp. Leaf2 TaxID=1735670 RepID=UPI0006F8FFA7|nr:UrcA family protein [Novosphingobium sp. Leaf2]KQM21810.1 UrcA family protein [Novosphingobium sp. Leaf2]
MFKKTAIIAAAVCTASLFAAPVAFAATTQVSFKDLDLQTPAGQKELNLRISRAARSVCMANVPTTGTIISRDMDRNCYKQAMEAVRAKVATAIDKADDTRLGG